MRKVAVFGLGRFGSAVARTLNAAGLEVLAVDKSRELVNALKDDVALAVSFDATDRETLIRFELEKMDAVVIGIGSDFEASVLTTLICHELGIPHIICKALTPSQREVLKLVGAHEVVLPEEQMGRWVAENLLHGSVVNLVDLPMGYLLKTIAVPPGWTTATLEELNLPTKSRVSLIQVHRLIDGIEQRFPVPEGGFQLLAGDTLDVIGPAAALADFDAPSQRADRRGSSPESRKSAFPAGGSGLD